MILSQEIKGSKRFKTKGLQNEEKLEIMFENLHNTGEDHWSASSGVPPSRNNEEGDDSPMEYGQKKKRTRTRTTVSQRR
jgi:hypothetical protein